MDLHVLYQDNDIILCVKPAGVLSEEDGMPELLRAQTGRQDIFCVHRLDRAVSGLMVYAGTKRSAAGLSAAIASGQLHKEYLAVVHGMPELRGTMRDLLFKDSARNKSYVVRRMRKGVREAELSYERLGTAGDLALVRVVLKTGRFHQIRVQFASRGMPLAGDVKYGSSLRDCPLALWSEALCFPHPVTGAEIHFRLPPPEAEPWSRFSLSPEDSPCPQAEES